MLGTKFDALARVFIPLPWAIFAKTSKGCKIAKTNVLTGLTSCEAIGGESRVGTIGSNQ